MIRTRLGVFIFLCGLMALASIGLPSGASAQEGVSAVKSEGVAIRAENIAGVKKNAIDQALKNAVASTLNGLIKAEGLEDFDLAAIGILSAPFSYVLNYRILSEGWITHMESVPPIASQLPESYGSFGQNPGGLELFHIWIEASVDSMRLHNDLSKLTLRQEKPAARITLNIIGVNDYATWRSLVDSLGQIPSIKDVSYSSFSRGRIVLALKSTGDGQTLSERIAGKIPGDFAVIPASERVIIIRAASNR